MKEHMIKTYSWLQAMMKSEKGQGMVEYALVLVLSVAIAAYFIGSGGLGEGVKSAVDATTSTLKASAK